MENKTSPKTTELREMLVKKVETNRANLTNRYIQTQRETLFTNRSEMQPSMLKNIASDEVDALLIFLQTPESSAVEHGLQLCQMGLSEQSMLGLGQVTRQFFLAFLDANLLAQALEILDSYQSTVIQGFIRGREKIILGEQEQIRSAFEIAISRYTIEIKEVQDMAKRATEANEFKSRFIARISHELRTPLGAMMGMAEMLKENIYGPLNSAQLDVVQRIFNNTVVLKQVFSELLDQSQIESGQLRLKEEQYSPKELVETIASNYLPMALQKGLSLHVDVSSSLPEKIVGDKSRVEQVLSNLVVNAIKFTQLGSITVNAFMDGKTAWVLQVKDTGIGIAPENQERVFDAFRQVEESATRKYGGVGLGLSIVQQLVLAMNGKISLESKLGQGSTFTVTLPV